MKTFKRKKLNILFIFISLFSFFFFFYSFIIISFFFFNIWISNFVHPISNITELTQALYFFLYTILCNICWHWYPIFPWLITSCLFAIPLSAPPRRWNGYSVANVKWIVGSFAHRSPNIYWWHSLFLHNLHHHTINNLPILSIWCQHSMCTFS